MLNDLNVRMCHITGTITGIYDRKLDKGVIKSGEDRKGNKWHIFELEVSKRDKKEGGWINGKNIKVTLFGEVPELKIGDPIGLGNSYFEPNNFTDSSGREIRGNGIVAYADNLFEPLMWEKKDEEGR